MVSIELAFLIFIGLLVIGLAIYFGLTLPLK